MMRQSLLRKTIYGFMSLMIALSVFNQAVSGMLIGKNNGHPVKFTVINPSVKPLVKTKKGATQKTASDRSGRVQITNRTGPHRESDQPIKKASTPNAIARIGWTEYMMLARIIHAEAGGEPLKGQVAVGAVILNRIHSGRFPRTVTANVMKNGEFESVSNGYIWSNPTESSYRAARLAINGWDPTNGAIYFYNPAKTSSPWIWGRPIVIQIGKHNFAV